MELDYIGTFSFVVVAVATGPSEDKVGRRVEEITQKPSGHFLQLTY